MTQAELAVVLKIAPNSLARLERNERKISGPVELAVKLLLETKKGGK
jgi:transcriptional regulator with XRE-family HTH domain